MYRKAFSVAYLWTLSFVPSSPCHLFFLTFSPPSQWIPPTTPQHRLTDAGLTDLLPSSFHWPPAWQQRFNAASSLARAWQVNLWLHCDLMPPAFEVSYSSVAYRTQKRCQVAIVKSYPWREVAQEYNSPDVMRGEKTFLWAQGKNGEMCDRIKCSVSIPKKMLWILHKILCQHQRARDMEALCAVHICMHLPSFDWAVLPQCACALVQAVLYVLLI